VISSVLDLGPIESLNGLRWAQSFGMLLIHPLALCPLYYLINVVGTFLHHPLPLERDLSSNPQRSVVNFLQDQAPSCKNMKIVKHMEYIQNI